MGDLNSLLQGGSTVIQLHSPPPLGVGDFPLPPVLERQSNRSWLHVDDLVIRPSLWIGTNIRIIVRRIEDSEFCNLFARVKMDCHGNITRDGEERVVTLNWILDMTTGNLSSGFVRGPRYMFNGHFRVRHAPFSRTLMRAVVMLMLQARRAKRRLLFRKWISTELLWKFNWQTVGTVTSYLWESRCPVGHYVTTEPSFVAE